MNAKKMYKKLAKDVKAVSPIIATLMLVLVAIGASVSFFVFESSWQGDIEGKMSEKGDDITSSEAHHLDIGGSTTVYEFSEVAIEKFLEKFPQYTIDLMAGGSGAGKKSCYEGLIDIGSASSNLKPAEIASYPDLQQYKVADDAVVLIVSATNPHVAAGDYIDIDDLYDVFSTNGGMPGALAALDTITVDGVISWDELAASADSTISGTVGTTDIVIYDRSEVSGTEETFSEKLCGFSTKTLEESGVTCDESHLGNPELLSAIESNPDALGFMSYGMASANLDKVTIVGWTQDDGTTTFTVEDDFSSSAYRGYRPINYLTKGNPEPLEQTYLDFCMAPGINQEICAEVGYWSIY